MIVETLNKYKNISWTFIDQGLVSGVNFLTGFFLARFLGIEEFGVYTLLWVFVLFTNEIQFSLISAPMMTIGPKLSGEGKVTFYSVSFVLQLIFSILTFLLLYACVSFFHLFQSSWNLHHLALPLASVGFLFQNQDFIRRYFFANNRPKDSLINDIVSYFGQFIILLGLVYKENINLINVYWVLSITSASAIAIGLLKVDIKRISFRDFKLHAKRSIGFSKWLTASGILQWISSNFVLLTAGAILGNVAVGAIKSAQNLIGVTHIIFQAMENFVPSNASRSYTTKGINGLYQYLKKIFLFLGGGVAIFCLVAFSFSDELMLTIYGEQYSEYGFILKWYAIIYMFIFICIIMRSGLIALENTKSVFVSYLLISIFTVSFSGLLVEYFNINGVLISILTAQLIMLSSLLFFTFKRINHVGRRFKYENNSYIKR
ncbi:MAG: oligosaccharide flippase family protein [Colwellia sp.]